MFGNNSVWYTQVFEWHKRFLEDQVDVGDDNCLVDLWYQSRTDENIIKVNEMLCKDWHKSVQMIADSAIIWTLICWSSDMTYK